MNVGIPSDLPFGPTMIVMGLCFSLFRRKAAAIAVKCHEFLARNVFTYYRPPSELFWVLVYGIGGVAMVLVGVLVQMGLL